MRRRDENQFAPSLFANATTACVKHGIGARTMPAPICPTPASLCAMPVVITGRMPFPQRLAYCVSKAGLDMMTRVMAIEWAARGVRVNAIAPGYVETEMVRNLSDRGLLDTGRLARRTPMGRLGTAEEIGEVAVFLASEAAGYMTGEVVTVDGGWAAYGFV